jgi:hypothetical protein
VGGEASPRREEGAYEPALDLATSFRTWCSDWREWVQLALLRGATGLYRTEGRAAYRPSDGDQWAEEPDDSAVGTDREEFERRLLALVRDYMDGADRLYPGGYEIEDFIVVYQLRSAPDPDESLEPWDGGTRPGSSFRISVSASTKTWSHDEAMLAEALRSTRKLRDERDAEEAADDEEEVAE